MRQGQIFVYLHNLWSCSLAKVTVGISVVSYYIIQAFAAIFNGVLTIFFLGV